MNTLLFRFRCVYLFVLAKVLALKCWQCDSTDSTYDTRCSHIDKMPTSMYNDCNGVCYKIVSPASGVQRQCAHNLMIANSICSSAQENGKDCSICDFDGCNSATTYESIAVLIALPILLMKIFSA